MRGHRIIHARRSLRAGLAVLMAAVLTVAAAVATSAPAQARAENGYDLPEAGVYLEGIGVDRRAGYVYVSATNRDGTVYRGQIGAGELSVWVGPSAGANGRGIAVDRQGLVYVAGGPNARVRVFDPDGALLADLSTGAAGSFPNDVWIGPDGAAYVTDSSLPVIWQVRHSGAGWQLESWLDVSPVIAYTPSPTDFDLGGIVSTPGGRYLLVVQGSTGQLWRISLRDKRIREVTLDAALVTADGLALRGHRLVVVQNFARQVTTLRLNHDWTAARTESVTPTPTDRTLTTADFAGGALLVVDSRFGFAAPPAENRVIALDLPRW
jgi:hypothetical protein